MKEKKNKYSGNGIKKDLALIGRGFKVLWEIHPAHMIWFTVYTVFKQILPYFALYMSALLVDEIVAGAPVPRLITLAVITVGGSLLIELIQHLLARKRDELVKMSFNLNELYLLRVQCRMQYKYFDQPDTALLRQTIRDHSNYGGHGLHCLKWTYDTAVGAIANIILSASLTVSMLRMSADAELTGFLAFVNSPLSSVIILAIIVANIAVMLIQINHFEPLHTEIWAGVNKRWARGNAYVSDMTPEATVMGVYALSLPRFYQLMVDDAHLRALRKNDIHSSLINYIFRAILSIALLIYVGAKAFIGVFGIGRFLVYRGTVEKFVTGVSTLSSCFARLRQNNVYLEELYSFLDLRDEMYHGTLSVEKRDDNRFEIEFRNVSFKYPGSETYALKDLSFKFRIGERLAFVGMNGSGKTTFIKLLCRLYDPTEGQILLNGIDITRYKYDEYLALFSVVFQDFYTFAFSLGENVACEVDYDRERVLDCLRRAGLGDKAEGLKYGLDTCITRQYSLDCVELSGGERQKVAIARALYKNAPFLILDEPTAALDPIAEAEVYGKFNEMVGERTAIYISHRLSSCRFCDEIAVFHEGRLIQRGNHDTLIADEGGKYHELWNAQAQYYVEEKSG